MLLLQLVVAKVLVIGNSNDGVYIISEAVTRRCSVKSVFLEVSQNSQENTCVGSLFNKIAGQAETLLEKRFGHKDI